MTRIWNRVALFAFVGSCSLTIVADADACCRRRARGGCSSYGYANGAYGNSYGYGGGVYGNPSYGYGGSTYGNAGAGGANAGTNINVRGQTPDVEAGTGATVRPEAPAAPATPSVPETLP